MTKRCSPSLVKDECDTCHICIGEGFIETYPNRVGSKKICGWCLDKLREQGRIEVGGRSRDLIEEQTTLYLHPDGNISRELVLHR